MSDFDEYLHADAIEKGDIIEISGKAHYVSAEEATFGRPYLELPVKTPAGKTKIYTPNKTTLKKLAKAWGDETDSWLGKKVQLDIVQQNVRGEMRDVIYGTPLQVAKEQSQEVIA
jgi:hypothetical protein